MSGFAEWAAGPGGDLTAAGCLLVLAVILAYLAGRIVGERRARDDARGEAEGAEYVGQLRPLPVWEYRAESRELAGQVVQMPLIASEDSASAAYWRSLDQRRHEDQALALVRDDLTDSAYTADMAARMDRFLEGLCGVPYSADELWSGQ